MRFNRRERGEGNFGCIVGLLVFLVALFIAYKMIPVKIKTAELRQVVTDEAKSAGTHKDDQIMRAILAKAEENKLPVTEENVVINRGNNEITVDVNYVIPVEFPGFTYQWKIRHLAQNPIF